MQNTFPKIRKLLLLTDDTFQYPAAPHNMCIFLFLYCSLQS